MISPTVSKARRALVVGAAALAAGLTLAACSGSSSGTTSSSSTPAGAGAAAGGGQAGRPAAAGQVAAISGDTMQVQSQQAGQVAVSWTSATKFSRPVTTTLTAVKTGDCVVATAPSGSSGTSFTATSLTVSTPVNGQCGGGAGGPGNGQRPSGQRPSGQPSGAPGQRAGGEFATGTVSSVSGSTIMVAARLPGSNGSTTNRTVTVDSQTKIVTQQSTTAQSLKVGLCVSAQGSAGSTGAVAATSVRISDPVNGQCSTGFAGTSNRG
jgi:hypothetical protein